MNDWASELAVRLGRPEDEIRKRGLSAYDFSPLDKVEVREATGLVHRVNFAFALVRPATNEAVVFTEHAGYLEFVLAEDAEVVEITERIYRHGG